MFEWVESATLDVTVERTVFLYTVLVAVAVAFLMTLVNMSFDYAKIVTFKEGRRSMLLASLRGIGFVFRHPLKTMGLYYVLVVLGALLLGLYASMAPGANQSTTAAVVWAFVIGQIALVVKLMLRLWFYAGQMALYEDVTVAPVEVSTTGASSGQ